MKPEAQRIAIAQALGWRDFHDGDSNKGWGLLGRHPSMHANAPKEYVPDYLSDLNAMHKAEKALTSVFHYVQILGEIVSQVYGDNRDAIRLSITATAAQRAEAFLRTLGKWTD